MNSNCIRLQPPNIDNVIFDLDGTLTDPGLGIMRSVSHVLTEMGWPAATEAQLRACVGPPIRENFTTVLGSDDPALIERAVEIYRERTGRIGIFENEIYPGVEQMLMALRDAGRNLLLATSRPLIYAGPILANFKLDGFFSSRYCAELDGSRSDKAELIGYLLQLEKLAPQDCIMIGDRKHDVIGAKKNGVATVGVTYGYGSEEELRESEADYLCGSPSEVTALLLSAAKT